MGICEEHMGEKTFFVCEGVGEWEGRRGYASPYSHTLAPQTRAHTHIGYFFE